MKIVHIFRKIITWARVYLYEYFISCGTLGNFFNVTNKNSKRLSLKAFTTNATNEPYLICKHGPRVREKVADCQSHVLQALYENVSDESVYFIVFLIVN